ncbi:cysteine hydrolase family protein [Pradoshia sp.]
MKSALLIIDVQNGMFHEGNTVFKGEELLRKLTKIINQARRNQIPLFYIQHNQPAGRPLEFGEEGWEIHPDIAPVNQDIVIQKWSPDSFFNTTLEAELKGKEIEHVIITGIQTEVCVDTTCRRAFSMGYKVTLVSDAHSTWDSKTLTAQSIIHHHNQVLRWFADVCPSDEVSESMEKYLTAESDMII